MSPFAPLIPPSVRHPLGAPGLWSVHDPPQEAELQNSTSDAKAAVTNIAVASRLETENCILIDSERSLQKSDENVWGVVVSVANYQGHSRPLYRYQNTMNLSAEDCNRAMAVVMR